MLYQYLIVVEDVEAPGREDGKKDIVVVEEASKRPRTRDDRI